MGHFDFRFRVFRFVGYNMMRHFFACTDEGKLFHQGPQNTATTRGCQHSTSLPTSRTPLLTLLVYDIGSGTAAKFKKC